MKRGDLTALGLTDEQIEKIIAENSKDIQNANKNAEKVKKELDDLKASAVNAEELQKKIEEIEESKLTETQKIAKELEKSNARVAELEKSIAIQQSRAEAAVNYEITAEEAKQVIRDDGSTDSVILGKIMKEKAAAAAAAKEKEIANASTNPGGQGAGGADDNSTATNMAVASAKRAGIVNESILNNYRR